MVNNPPSTNAAYYNLPWSLNPSPYTVFGAPDNSDPAGFLWVIPIVAKGLLEPHGFPTTPLKDSCFAGFAVRAGH